MILSDFKIVDLKRSDINWDASDESKGIYKFNHKVYYNRIPEPGDKYFPKWCTDDNEGNLQNWIYGFDASEIKYEDKDYWPEPMKPNATHGYKFKDAVLMRVNLEMWVDKVEKDRKMANGQVAANKAAFNAQTAMEGASLDVDPETIKAFEEGKVNLV